MCVLLLLLILLLLAGRIEIRPPEGSKKPSGCPCHVWVQQNDDGSVSGIQYALYQVAGRGHAMLQASEVHVF